MKIGKCYAYDNANVARWYSENGTARVIIAETIDKAISIIKNDPPAIGIEAIV